MSRQIVKLLGKFVYRFPDSLHAVYEICLDFSIFCLDCLPSRLALNRLFGCLDYAAGLVV